MLPRLALGPNPIGAVPDSRAGGGASDRFTTDAVRLAFDFGHVGVSLELCGGGDLEHW